ncbi:hypothetical protein HDV01_007448 [Terramyces sp. JEL0728]|nr:hypothetical protein HDV01_007448 [Terramyces sp. JEL0728]
MNRKVGLVLLCQLALAQSPTATVSGNSTVVTDIAMPSPIQGMCYKKNRHTTTTTVPPPKPTKAAAPAANPPSQPQQQGLSSFAQSCVDAHNRYRDQRGLPHLTWSFGSLEQHAVNWANTMFSDNSMFHSQTPGMGENIAMGQGMNCGQAVSMWMGEQAYWDGGPVTGSNFGSIGHFTQVMWRDTKQVSCSAEGSYLVCNYLPQGNLLGHMPF